MGNMIAWYFLGNWCKVDLRNFKNSFGQLNSIRPCDPSPNGLLDVIDMKLMPLQFLIMWWSYWLIKDLLQWMDKFKFK